MQKKNLFWAKITFSGTRIYQILTSFCKKSALKTATYENLYATFCQFVSDSIKSATFVQFHTHFNAYRLFLYTGAVLYRHLRRLSLGDYARYKRFVRIFGVVRVFYIRDLLNIRTELFMLPKYYFLLLWIKPLFQPILGSNIPLLRKGFKPFYRIVVIAFLKRTLPKRKLGNSISLLSQRL